MKLRIVENYENIKNYLKDLEELKISKIEILNNKEKYYASSMIVFSILNDFIVLADEFIDELDLEIAQVYKEIFEILKKNNYISDEELIFCKRLVYLRNKLAHEYGEIEISEIFELIENIKNIKKMIENLLENLN